MPKPSTHPKPGPRFAAWLLLAALPAATVLTACALRPEPTLLAPVPAPAAAAETPAAPAAPGTLTGEAALGDWTTDAPGVRRRITTKDLPRPYATPSVDNGPRMVARPEGALPKAPEGFTVEAFATGLNGPRQIQAAPNGDLFLTESEAGRVRVLADRDGDGRPEINTIFAEGLRQPFGIAFYPPGPNPTHVYVANTDSVIRFPYQGGDSKARGASEIVTDTIPGGGRLRGGGHWTRDIRFSKEGRRMFVSVGSLSNVWEKPQEQDESGRAMIHAFDPDGKNGRPYATGIRNAVGLAVHPQTGALWCSVNERDGLGDHLVPDYVTSVKEGGFYGWPWYYLGPNQDPRHAGAKPELKSRVLVPDVLLQSHSASLGMTFAAGTRFPQAYQADAFAAEHGSWNRARRTGYKVVRIPMKGGRATGEYEDFLTGFVTPNGDVWGRPVGVAVGKDGALYVTDDGGNVVWRVRHGG